LIPFLGWAMKRAGHVSLDRENPRKALKAMDEAAQRIQDGTNILVFPEGTRSVDGNLLPFKKGAFNLAMKACVPIVPVGICGTSMLQPEGSQVPVRGGAVSIHLGEPIPVAGRGVSYKTELANEVRAAITRLVACQKS
jgi:1-acyl-sn-glycerol-3-phosphate acyltransferase